MKKYFKTIDEQIEILKNRGLIIEDENHAKEILHHYNYYKVVNGTNMFFSDQKKPYNFRQGVTFKDLEALHVFDKEIKKLLLNAVLDAERHLRSVISYIFMMHHQEANAYLNPKNFNDDKALVDSNIYSLEATLSNFEDDINYKKSMAYYKDKYKHVPFWFLINFVSFGRLVNIYQTLKEKEAYEVANEFTKFLVNNLPDAHGYYLTPKQFESVIENIKEIRNICAHDNLILDYKCQRGIENIGPLHKAFEIEKNHKKDDVFNVIIAMQIFLYKEEYNQLEKGIKERIAILKKELDDKAFKKVMMHMGFAVGGN